MEDAVANLDIDCRGGGRGDANEGAERQACFRRILLRVFARIGDEYKLDEDVDAQTSRILKLPT